MPKFIPLYNKNIEINAGQLESTVGSLRVLGNWNDLVGLGWANIHLLADVGFEVATLTPPASIVRKIKSANSHYTYRPWSPSSSILHAIKDFRPDFIVCADDQAVRDLHRIYLSLINTINDRTDLSYIGALIARSLGNPESYSITTAKSKFIAFAQSVGSRRPKTLVMDDEFLGKYELENSRWPIVIKADQSYGGRGVRIVKSGEFVNRSFRQVVISHTWLKAVSALIRGLSPYPLIDRVSSCRRTVTLQEFIAGRIVNRAVVCLNGRILVGISVEALQTMQLTGPATLVRVIDHQEMTDVCKVLVEKLGLSGYCGFDFILDDDNRAWLLELNPRVTPIAAVAVRGRPNLAGALFAALTNSKCIREVPSIGTGIIALYPQSKSSPAKYGDGISSYSDVWQNESEFIHASSISWRQSNYFGAMLGQAVRRMSHFGRSAKNS